VLQAVVSDNPGCGGWQYAQRHGIEVLQFPSKRHPPGEHAVELPELPAALQAVDVDYICLAGFLKVGAGNRLKLIRQGSTRLH
jgi:folate-dependent phosphoribosylglycinamide formyltransferase PurN